MKPRWSVLWSGLLAVTLVACVGESSPEPGMLLPPAAIAPAASPSVVQAQTPLLPTPIPIASSPPPLSPSLTLIASSSPSTTRPPATIASSLPSPAPTTPVPKPSQVPTPGKTASATATPTLPAAAAPTPAGTCECPKHGTGAPDSATPAGYKLVSYGCVLNYVMADWWPQNLFDDEETFSKTTGNEETAVVYVSSDTHVYNYTMLCRVVLTWTFQPVAATPSPRTTATPSGDLYRVWQLPSIEHAGASVAKSLGIATGPEQAVWMSEASIDSLYPPKPLQMHDHIFRRLDNNQVSVDHETHINSR